MSVADYPFYQPRLYRRARLGLLILALLGLMGFAAVQDMARQCRTEQGCLALEKGGCLGLNGGGVLILYAKTTRCDLTGWGLRVALPEWAAGILRESRNPDFLHLVLAGVAVVTGVWVNFT